MSQQEILQNEWGNTRVKLGTVVFLVLGIPTFCLLSRSSAQFAFAPLVLLILWRISVFTIRVPLGVFIVAGLGVIAGAALRYSDVTLSKGAFLVSTSSDEQLQKESKIYRDRMRRVVGSGSELLIGVHHGRIQDATQARRLLDKNLDLGGVVWGGTRWMTASLQRYTSLGFTEFPQHSFARDFLERNHLADLLIMRSVPSIGVSDGHSQASLAFLAKASVLWRKFPEVATPTSSVNGFDAQAIDLATMRARWTSTSHLAFAMWMAGTMHLVRAIEGEQVDLGELRCAHVRLKQALKNLRVGDNPNLEIAIRGNYALTRIIESDVTPNGNKAIRAAIRHLHVASRPQLAKSENVANVIHNRVALEQSIIGEIHGKRRR